MDSAIHPLNNCNQEVRKKRHFLWCYFNENDLAQRVEMGKEEEEEGVKSLTFPKFQNMRVC